MADENEKKESAATPPTATQPGASGEGGDRVFTQTELDAIVQERLRRERDKYQDYEDTKKKAAQWDEHQQAQLSELEKAAAQIAALKEAQTMQATSYNENLLRLKAQVIATQAGFRNPEHGYLLADLSGVTVGENGEIAGLQEAIEALAKREPYLLTGELPKPRAPQMDAGVGNHPESGGAALTPGMQTLAQAAAQAGYVLDPEKVRSRTRQMRGRVVSGPPGESTEE